MDVYESALCPFIASRSQSPHSGSTWRMWWRTGSNRVNVVELVISIVACRLQVQIWCSFRCVLASLLRRKVAINGCSTQGRSVLRTAIPTPCLGFSAISKPLQHIAWYSLLIQMNSSRLRRGKLTGCCGCPVPVWSKLISKESVAFIWGLRDRTFQQESVSEAVVGWRPGGVCFTHEPSRASAATMRGPDLPVA